MGMRNWLTRSTCILDSECQGSAVERQRRNVRRYRHEQHLLAHILFAKSCTLEANFDPVPLIASAKLS